MFTMGSTAFAEETVNKVQTSENAGTVTFTKEYKLEGQEGHQKKPLHLILKVKVLLMREMV